jgi:beta-galactosidase
MVHGGTNFGLTAGANSKNELDSYTADITTYDYDAPINEQGDYNNSKYRNFRDMASYYVDWSIPSPPPPIPTIEIPAFKPYKVADLLANIPASEFSSY